jgi:thiol-disulfide isomerase/thioredoxin
MTITDNVYLRAAVLTTVVFTVGVIIGLWLGQEKVSSLETGLTNLKGSIANTELQFLLLDTLKGNMSCNYLLTQADSLANESGVLAVEVDRYENAQKIDDASFVQLKTSYITVLINDWLTLEKIKRTCGGTYATVLYFYSNKKCDKCLDQGIVLSYLKEKLGNDIMTFALDGDLGMSVVNSLKAAYGITEYPTLVINGDVYNGYTDLNKTTRSLCSYNSNFSVCNQSLIQ